MWEVCGELAETQGSFVLQWESRPVTLQILEQVVYFFIHLHIYPSPLSLGRLTRNWTPLGSTFFSLVLDSVIVKGTENTECLSPEILHPSVVLEAERGREGLLKTGEPANPCTFP